MFHELDVGHEKIAAYLKDPANNTVLISDASGTYGTPTWLS